MEPRGPFVDDRYEFLRLLATGGMGQVWCARDSLLQRDVAVKVLRSEFTGNPTFLARFRAEAQHTAALAHPNIAALYDYGELVPGPDGVGEHVAYLVMELVDGESLSALLAREGQLAPDRTLRLLRQAAAGLAAAHSAGVVHRDVKPANLLVGRDDAVKVTDFGIASSTASVPLTQTGQVIGTAHYLSPEQAQGARATPASDVYALGMVAYECLSGRRAFDGENSVQIALMQIREVPPSLPPDVPPAVRQLVRAALAKDPAQRLPDGAAFRDAVDAVLAGRMPVLPTEATSSILVPGLLPGLVPTPSDVPDTDPVVAPAEAPSGRWRPRSPMRSRPRLVAACVAALAAGLVVAGVLHAGGTPITTAAEGAGSGPVPATAPAPRTVQLNPDDYVGLPLGDVEARLAALGLQVGVRQITTADVPAGQVIALGPTGQLAPGQTVTVTVAAAPAPAPAAPTPTPGGAVQAASGGAATARPPSAVPSPVVVQQAGQTAPKNDRGNGRGGGKGKQGDD